MILSLVITNSSPAHSHGELCGCAYHLLRRERESSCLETNPLFHLSFPTLLIQTAQGGWWECSALDLSIALLQVRFWCYASPRCKSSIRTFSRHPNCRNCGWRLSIDHRVTPGPGALSRLYPAPARGNHTTGDRSAHATSLSPFQVCNFKLHSQSIPNNFLVSQSIPDHNKKKQQQTDFFCCPVQLYRWHCHW